MANRPKRPDDRKYRAKKGAKRAFSKVAQLGLLPLVFGVGIAGVGGNVIMDSKTEVPDLQEGTLSSLSVEYYESQIASLSQQKANYQDQSNSRRTFEKWTMGIMDPLLAGGAVTDGAETQKTPEELLTMLYNDQSLSEHNFEVLIADFTQEVADPAVFGFTGTRNAGVLRECRAVVDQEDWLSGDVIRADGVDACMTLDQGFDAVGTIGYMMLLFMGGTLGGAALQSNRRVKKWLNEPPKKPASRYKH